MRSPANAKCHSFQRRSAECRGVTKLAHRRPTFIFLFFYFFIFLFVKKSQQSVFNQLNRE
jgi:hypothetical protein